MNKIRASCCLICLVKTFVSRLIILGFSNLKIFTSQLMDITTQYEFLPYFSLPTFPALFLFSSFLKKHSLGKHPGTLGLQPDWPLVFILLVSHTHAGMQGHFSAQSYSYTTVTTAWTLTDGSWCRSSWAKRKIDGYCLSPIDWLKTIQRSKIN